MTHEATIDAILNIVKAHEEWRGKKCINLDAAEGTPSPVGQSLLAADINRRVPTHRGARCALQLEEITGSLAKRLFKVDFAEFRFWGCSIANAVTLRCLTEVGDQVLALEKPRGHKSYREAGYGGHRGLQYHDIPYDNDEFNIDLDGFTEVARKHRPRLIIVGTSLFLFPHPLREMSRIAEDLGAKIMYDGAHVLGLIAGGRFQDPLREGAFVLTGSSQKTLGGPMGGWILHNDADFDKKMKPLIDVYQGPVGNRIPALAVAVAEMLTFGKDYADQVIRNAKALATALDQEGLDMIAKKKGFTESHTIVMNAERIGGGATVSHILEEVNIICNEVALWRSDEKPRLAVRIGTPEVTRYGMKEQDMATVANFIRRAVIDREQPSRIREEVSEFRSQFLTVKYC